MQDFVRLVSLNLGIQICDYVTSFLRSENEDLGISVQIINREGIVVFLSLINSYCPDAGIINNIAGINAHQALKTERDTQSLKEKIDEKIASGLSLEEALKCFGLAYDEMVTGLGGTPIFDEEKEWKIGGAVGIGGLVKDGEPIANAEKMIEVIKTIIERSKFTTERISKRRAGRRPNFRRKVFFRGKKY